MKHTGKLRLVKTAKPRPPAAALPDGQKFKLIYADPPWLFRNYSKKGEDRNAVKHYPCMKTEDICTMPVGDVADDDCVLLIWATDPQLPDALKVLEAWGFKYKTVGFYWVKTRKHALLDRLGLTDFIMGLGYWTRANPEICILATRGKPSRLSKAVRRLVVSPRREHSRKPDEIYDFIETLAEGPYLELFARSRRPGWTSWGNEVGKYELIVEFHEAA